MFGVGWRTVGLGPGSGSRSSGAPATAAGSLSATADGPQEADPIQWGQLKIQDLMLKYNRKRKSIHGCIGYCPSSLHKVNGTSRKTKGVKRAHNE